VYTANPDINYTEIIQDIVTEPPVVPDNHGKQGSPADFNNIERRVQTHTVFHVDDTSFASSMPRATHWSIAWSDLMMTMFILFLSMFVYQSANQEFLGKKAPEILGGDTTAALESIGVSGAEFPFAPIHPGIPLMTAGTIKKVEPVHEDISRSNPDPLPPAKELPEALAASAGDLELVQQDRFQEIFALSKNALEDNNLNQFATVDIIPDKTMRIILTSDLLFGLGKSELTKRAEESLKQIAQIIQSTPYMINVVGHTDNVPMQSYRFKSNWELSVARASTVTRFFIDETKMNPLQFVVSGYSSYRPIKPNTTAENRAKNRRVEIIISRKLPNPTTPTTENLH